MNEMTLHIALYSIHTKFINQHHKTLTWIYITTE